MFIAYYIRGYPLLVVCCALQRARKIRRGVGGSLPFRILGLGAPLTQIGVAAHIIDLNLPFVGYPPAPGGPARDFVS